MRCNSSNVLNFKFCMKETVHKGYRKSLISIKEIKANHKRINLLTFIFRSNSFNNCKQVVVTKSIIERSEILINCNVH